MPSPFLLTPYRRVQRNTPEWRYSQEHKACRSSVETTFGALSGVWRIVKRERAMRYDPVTAAMIVVAAAFLHNYVILNG